MEMFLLDVLSGVVCYISVIVGSTAVIGAVADRIARRSPPRE